MIGSWADQLQAVLAVACGTGLHRARVGVVAVGRGTEGQLKNGSTQKSGRRWQICSSPEVAEGCQPRACDHNLHQAELGEQEISLCGVLGSCKRGSEPPLVVLNIAVAQPREAA